MRSLSKLGLLVACAVVTVSPALAIGGGSGTFTDPLKNSDDSAELRNGTWSFDTWSPGPKWPGFHYAGMLKDTKPDGDWVYTRGKVDGYGWAGDASAENHNGASAKAVSISQKVWGADPPSEAKIQVCRHRDGLYPNTCTESGWKHPK